MRSLKRESDLYLERSRHSYAEGQFVGALSQYLSVLDSTVLQLVDVAEKLYGKSQDPSEYRWREYTDDIEAYRKSVEHYVELGGRLNRLAQRLP